MPQTTEGAQENALLVGSRFSITLAGHGSEIKNVTDVGGLNAETGVVEKQQTDEAGKIYITKTAGNQTYGEVTIKRFLSKDKAMWDWMKKVRDRTADHRVDGDIFLYNFAGEIVAKWTFLKAWPSKWSIGDLDASSDDPMTEELTLVIEQIERTQ